MDLTELRPEDLPGSGCAHGRHKAFLVAARARLAATEMETFREWMEQRLGRAVSPELALRVFGTAAVMSERGE